MTNSRLLMCTIGRLFHIYLTKLTKFKNVIIAAHMNKNTYVIVKFNITQQILLQTVIAYTAVECVVLLNIIPRLQRRSWRRCRPTAQWWRCPLVPLLGTPAASYRIYWYTALEFLCSQFGRFFFFLNKSTINFYLTFINMKQKCFDIIFNSSLPNPHQPLLHESYMILFLLTYLRYNVLNIVFDTMLL